MPQTELQTTRTTPTPTSTTPPSHPTTEADQPTRQTTSATPDPAPYVASAPTEAVVTDTLARLRTVSFEPPTRSERQELTQVLLLEAATCGDPERRKQLLDDVVVLNRVVAESLARRYRHRGVALEDLEQAALEGLVKAVDKFDPTVRPDLLTYAVPTIRGEIQRYFRDHSWTIRPPRRIQELQWRISRSVESLSLSLGREPTETEICGDLECTRGEYDQAVQAFGLFQPTSLDHRPRGSDGAALADLVPDLRSDDQLGHDGQDAAEARTVLAPVVRTLGERDRRILFMRFFEGRSQAEIGEELGVTQMQVSRLLARILKELRGRLSEPVEDDLRRSA